MSTCNCSQQLIQLRACLFLYLANRRETRVVHRSSRSHWFTSSSPTITLRGTQHERGEEGKRTPEKREERVTDYVVDAARFAAVRELFRSQIDVFCPVVRRTSVAGVGGKARGAPRISRKKRAAGSREVLGNPLVKVLQRRVLRGCFEIYGGYTGNGKIRRLCSEPAGWAGFKSDFTHANED